MRDKTKESAGYKLFHYKYACLIPETEVNTKQHREIFGTFVSGDEKIDRGIANSLVDAYRTPVELALIVSRGGSVEIPDSDKAYEVYNFIIQHLQDVIEFQRAGYFGRVPPLEDLQILDQFAAKLFSQARWHHVGEREETSKLMEFFKKTSKRGTKGGNKGIEGSPEDSKREHTPLSNKINLKRLDGVRQWK